MLRTLRVLAALAVVLATAGCSTPEDPARVQLRARLSQAAQLSPDEVGRLLDEVGRSIEGKTVRYTHDRVTQELDPEKREIVLGMLTDRAGLFDEGLVAGDPPLRVINAPAKQTGAEVEAMRKLFIDVETLIPRRFQFTHGVRGMEEYSYDLEVN